MSEILYTEDGTPSQFHKWDSSKGEEISVRRYIGSDRPGAPCVLWIHGGGGLVGGHVEHYEWQIHDFTHLVPDGSNFISVQYPLAPGPQPKNQIKTCITAFNTVRQHAEELGIDKDNIIMAGASHGANLALSAASSEDLDCPPKAVVCLYGVHDLNDRYFKESNDFPSEEFGKIPREHSDEEIQREIDFRSNPEIPSDMKQRVTYAPSNFPDDWTAIHAAFGKTDVHGLKRKAAMQRDILSYSLAHRKWMETLIPKNGRTENEWRDDLEKQSSKSHVNSKTPSTLLVTGMEDTLVPPTQTLEISRILKDCGVPTETIVVEKKGHLFDKKWPALGRNKYRDSMFSFMSSHAKRQSSSTREMVV